MKDKVLVFGLVGESVFMQTDHFHETGETVTINTLHKEPGGKGFNQAITLARLGIKTTFIGTIGNDYYTECEKFLKKENLSYHLIVKNGCSAYACILTNKDGENQVSVYPGVNQEFDDDDVRKYEDEFVNAKYVLIQAELPECVVKEVINIAFKHNVKVILNPAPAQPFIKNYLDKVYLVTPNLHEFNTLFSLSCSSAYEIKKSLESIPLSQIIITLGGDGAIIKEDNVITKLEALTQNNVVDTTGAGDVFNGALVSGLMMNKNLGEASRFAIKASSLSVTMPYVMPSIPSLEKVEKLSR